MGATIHFLVVVYATAVIHNLDHNTQGIARSKGIVELTVCIGKLCYNSFLLCFSVYLSLINIQENDVELARQRYLL